MVSAREGDLVLVDKKGRRFHAELGALMPDGNWLIKAIAKNITYKTASSREVVKLWRAPRRQIV